MKILHICLAAFYIDGYSYQENILPKEHLKLGYEVEIVASTETFVDKTNLGYIKPSQYINEDGIKVTRLPYSRFLPHFLMKKIRSYRGLYSLLDELKPDILFIHDLQFFDVFKVKKYMKKNCEVIAISDCHTDFSNSARGFISKYILHKGIYKYYVKSIEKFISKFYGVLPARVDFLVDVYKVNKEKVSLLVMGAEDEKVALALKNKDNPEYKARLGISDDDFVVVTGGKIDYHKRQIFELAEAVLKLNIKNLKLIIFGSIHDQFKEKMIELTKNDSIKYIGWVDTQESYNLFAIAKIAIFPGRHSVYWEQAAGTGTPLMVLRWPGTEHVNTDNNCIFLEKGDNEEIYKEILDLYNSKSSLKTLKDNALKAMPNFSYKEIARRALDYKQ